MALKVQITKGSSKYPKDAWCEVYATDIERLGIHTVDKSISEDDKGGYYDEDDEEYYATLGVENQQVVRTWFLLASPVDGKLRWIEDKRCRGERHEGFVKRGKLSRLRSKCLGCRKCDIGGQYVEGYPACVLSNLNRGAKIMVIGQNPGATECEEGEPFVGRSGQFFDKMIKKHCNWTRDDLYITNVVKCYTPKNRAPNKKEIENCRKYLEKEIQIIRPHVILSLGNFALHWLTGKKGITKMHGEFLDTKYGWVLPLLHPSPLNMNKREKREQFVTDLKKLRKWSSWKS